MEPFWPEWPAYVVAAYSLTAIGAMSLRFFNGKLPCLAVFRPQMSRTPMLHQQDRISRVDLYP